MKSFRFHPVRLARRLRQFNLSLLATLAALALTACSDEVPVAPAPSTSVAQGVQQILHAKGARSAADGTHTAQVMPN